MGLANKLVQSFGVGALMETIKEKAPPLYTFIVSLDECSLMEAVGIFLEEDQKYKLTVKPGKMIDLNKKPIDTLPFIIRILKGKEPFLNVINDLLKVLGVDNISDINVKEFLENACSYEDKK